MLTDGKDLVVIDEWPDADSFNKFFAGAARMGEFLSGAGVVGEGCGSSGVMQYAAF